MKKRKLILAAFAASLLMGCSNPNEEGMAALKEGNYQEAITAFQEMTAKEIQNEDVKKKVSDAYRGMGMAYWELEDYEQCKENYLSALELGTEQTGTLYNFLGVCDMKLGQYESAITYFDKGLVLEEAGSELAKEMEFNQVSAYEALKDWENAKKKIASYIEKYPDDEVAAKEAEFLKTR